MSNKLKSTVTALALAAGLFATSAVYADEDKSATQRSMMHSGQGGMMGPGMMTHGMMRGDRGGMMGHGMMGQGFGDRVVPSTHLSTDDVRHFLEHRLARRGNKRLKVGEVKEEGKDSIVADIVTVDDSLVERLKVDRHTGRIEHVN